MGDDRLAARQAHLATMGVACEVELKPRFGGNIGEFGGMNQGDLKALRRPLERGSGGLRIILVNIIRTDELYVRPALLDAPGFIDQNLDPDALESRHHLGAVVVAKDRVGSAWGRHPGQEALEVGQDMLEGTGHPFAVISGQDADVDPLSGD